MPGHGQAGHERHIICMLLWLKAGAAGELIEPQAVRAAAAPNRARVVKEVRIVGMVLPWLRVEMQRVLCAAAKAVGASFTPLYGAIATLDSKSFQIFLK